jgi:hypothetical protein
MDIPLLIAILAILGLLAWTLLPGLDHFVDQDMSTDGSRSYISRLVHWVND